MESRLCSGRKRDWEIFLLGSGSRVSSSWQLTSWARWSSSTVGWVSQEVGVWACWATQMIRTLGILGGFLENCMTGEA
ncbi:hypothetical protein QJS10_CPB19g00258 [Acorus calamus]|uniref:Uncharacterized protein n=1 Tax=Acorus calamus TaxID=4465 RepID=A0AAV9CIH9_ACOCL|nr:hypothetical protein QJS10_CPB19g00258 [Acorus calamus]